MNRIVVLWDKTMPVGFGRPLTQRVWRECAKGMTARFAAPSDLAGLLDRADLFVNPYGSVFPVESWPVILAYLENGGNFLNWGGIPFRAPVAGNPDTGWRPQRPCANYHKKIGVVQSYTYSPDADKKVVSCHPRLDGIVKEKSLVCSDVYPLTIRSIGPSGEGVDADGHIKTPTAEYQALLHLVQKGVRVAAPITRMDRLYSPWAGGRWVFVTMNLGQLTEQQLTDWVDLLPPLLNMAIEGATAFEVAPTFASYLAGERPSLRVSARIRSHSKSKLFVRLSIRPPNGHVEIFTRKIDGTASPVSRFEISLRKPCQPGFYRIQGVLRQGDEPIEKAICGFWGRDEKLLSQGEPLTTDRDMIRRGGEVYPLIGASYVATHSEGTFLRWINPGVWDKDFAEMAAAGVRVVRTGLWGEDPRFLMPKPGVWREDALRALDAFILTAQRHRIPVLFTFFGSTPPLYGGVNPYLDPQSLSAQEEFVQTLVERYKNCPGILWDLIDEPAQRRNGPPRPNGDRWELRAWREWLRKRHGDIDSLREGWNVRSDAVPSLDAVPLPAEEDFDVYSDRLGERTPLRVLDYILFSQEVFADWARRIRSVCRSTGSCQLVTVGQGEGSCLSRLSPLHQEDTVDFTSVHTCWQSDAPLWERIVTKLPDMPNVVNETEPMYVESLDGEAWRTEEESAALLERKYLYALATASAGAVHWMWPRHGLVSDNRQARFAPARSDGTQNPQYVAHRRAARFWCENRKYWVERRQDQIALVLPNSSQFPFREGSILGTRRAIKVLTKALHVGAKAVSEEDFSRLGQPKMVILPSPGWLSERAWKTLVAFVEAGGTLVMSGVVERGPYFRVTSRLGEVGIPGLGPMLLSSQELMFMSGDQFLLTYSGFKQHWLEREAWTGEASIWESHVGKGFILYSPLPLELADQFAPVVHFYNRGMALAGVEPPLIIDDYIPTTYIRLIRYREVDLVVAVNEANDPVAMGFSIRDLGGNWRIELPAQRGGAFLIHRAKCKMIDEY